MTRYALTARRAGGESATPWSELLACESLVPTLVFGILTRDVRCVMCDGDGHG
jgi:hypothetical protein